MVNPIIDRRLVYLQILRQLGDCHVIPLRFERSGSNLSLLSFQKIGFQKFDKPLGDSVDVLGFKLDFHGGIISCFRKKECCALDVAKGKSKPPNAPRNAQFYVPAAWAGADSLGAIHCINSDNRIRIFMDRLILGKTSINSPAMAMPSAANWPSGFLSHCREYIHRYDIFIYTAIFS